MMRWLLCVLFHQWCYWRMEPYYHGWEFSCKKCGRNWFEGE